MKTLRATPAQVASNLLAVFSQAGQPEVEDGKHWYTNAHNECVRLSELYHIPLVLVVGIVAALSPRCRWEDNITFAAVFMAQGNGEGIPLYSNSLDKAARILAGEHPLTVLGGPKTKAFYSNLLDPECADCNCIDTWMARAAYADRAHTGNITQFEYDVIEQAVHNIAKRVGLIPCQVQAIIWITIRQPQLKLF